MIIDRIVDYTKLELPQACEDIKMPPNEWVDYNNMNSCMDQLIENYEYLEKMTTIYDTPPNSDTNAWFGYDAASGTQWYDSNNVTNATSGDLLSAAHDILINQQDWFILANSNYIQILSGDDTGTFIDEINYSGPGSEFGEIKSIGIDSKDKIFVLDSINLRVVVLSYNLNYTEIGQCGPWQVENIWGRFGGPTSNYGYKTMTDMFIYNDQVYILDNKNNVIKVYTNNGIHNKTIIKEEFNGAKSLLVSGDNIFVLTSDDKILKLELDGTYINKFSFTTSDDVPYRIRPSYDNIFIYISMPNHIAKITTDGQFVGIFTGVGDKQYEGLYNHTDGKLYIANNLTILEFKDEIELFKFKPDTSEYLWDNDDLYIKKNEYVTAWVYNRIFARFYDNLEIFRRSLYGKPIVVFDVVDLGPGSILGILKSVSIRPFVEDELAPFKYKKEDIYIGVNELVTADVINRCLGQLCELQTHLIDLIDERGFLYLRTNKVFEDYINMMSEDEVYNRVPELSKGIIKIQLR